MGLHDLKAALSRSRVRLAVGASAALVLAAALGAAAVTTEASAAQLRDRGVRTGAAVVRVDNKSASTFLGGVRFSDVVTVTFTDSHDRLVRASYVIDRGYHNSPDHVAPGGTVQIIYDPLNPAHIRGLPYDEDDATAGMEGIAAAAALAGSAVLAFRLRRKAAS